MQYGYVELRYIIEWARKVPGMYDEEALFTTVEPPFCGHTFVQLPLFYDQKICWTAGFPLDLENLKLLKNNATMKKFWNTMWKVLCKTMQLLIHVSVPILEAASVIKPSE